MTLLLWLVYQAKTMTRLGWKLRLCLCCLGSWLKFSVVCCRGDQAARLQRSLLALKPGSLKIREAGEAWISVGAAGEQVCMKQAAEVHWDWGLDPERLLPVFVIMEDGPGCRLGRDWRNGSKLEVLKASIGSGWELLVAMQRAVCTHERAHSHAQP